MILNLHLHLDQIVKTFKLRHVKSDLNNEVEVTNPVIENNLINNIIVMFVSVECDEKRLASLW